MNRSLSFLSRQRTRLPIVLLALLNGCSTAYHHEKADEEAYDLLDAAEREVFGKESGLNIDTRYSDRPPEEWAPEEIFSERLGEKPLEASLEDIFAIAIENSREYQTRKENLFFAALEFSDERHAFGPQFFASSEVSTTRTSDGERIGEVNSQVGVDKLLTTGARIGVTVTNDILHVFAGDSNRTATSAISVNLVQPLLRGAGASVVAENLTQVERDLIYEIRDFSLFQQTFAVDIASSYYGILQLQDEVRNEYNSYQNLILARERADALAEGDRLAEFQADQARQDELRARNRYVFVVERYLNAVDNFKLELGVPVGVHLLLDEAALQDLDEAGLIPIRFNETQALAIALDSRLDLINEIDRFEDSQRKIVVAADQLKADLNLFADVSLPSRGDTDYASFDFNDYSTSVGLGLNLPLDRLRERNFYRASIIQFERQIRTLGLAIDELRSDLRESLRSIDQARQTYLIQQRAVELADRRVESANLLFEFGRAEIRDLLEAEQDRLEARNSLTGALIDYHIGRYRFLRNLGILEVDEEGLWIRRVLSDPDETAPSTERIPETDVITPEELFSR